MFNIKLKMSDVSNTDIHVTYVFTVSSIHFGRACYTVNRLRLSRLVFHPFRSYEMYDTFKRASIQNVLAFNLHVKCC